MVGCLQSKFTFNQMIYDWFRANAANSKYTQLCLFVNVIQIFWAISNSIFTDCYYFNLSASQLPTHENPIKSKKLFITPPSLYSLTHWRNCYFHFNFIIISTKYACKGSKMRIDRHIVWFSFGSIQFNLL